ncbi:MAG: protein tyrosine/serine phosphatase [Candidatus Azotimanducaceae bacterium]|jgi:protein tyrosine/serine phosphatase
MNATDTTSTRVQKIARIVGWTLLVTILIGYTWKEHIEDRIIPKRWGVVEQASVYRSGQLHPSLIQRVLVEHNIGVIIDLNGKRAGKVEHETEDSVAKNLGIDKNRYPLNGNGTGDVEQYIQAIAAIDAAVSSQTPVLVHCSAGTQRTGGVIAMYRVLVQKRSVDFALAEMESYNWDPIKDQVLSDYLDNNIETIAQKLVSLAVIDKLPSSYPSFQSVAVPSPD